MVIEGTMSCIFESLTYDPTNHLSWPCVQSQHCSELRNVREKGLGNSIRETLAFRDFQIYSHHWNLVKAKSNKMVENSSDQIETFQFSFILTQNNSQKQTIKLPG